MLAIRMQRTGRSGYAMFRMVVQDSHRSPTSGKVVAYLGSYDPHNKQVQINKEKTGFYLEHGAQPSPRVIAILKAEKVNLPKWVEEPKPKKRAVKNPDKRRSTAPAKPAAEQQPAPEAEANEASEGAAKQEVASEESQAAADSKGTEAAAEKETSAEQTPAEPDAEEAPQESDSAESPQEPTDETA